jgi:hypothetical protein
MLRSCSREATAGNTFTLKVSHAAIQLRVPVVLNDPAARQSGASFCSGSCSTARWQGLPTCFRCRLDCPVAAAISSLNAFELSLLDALEMLTLRYKWNEWRGHCALGGSMCQFEDHMDTYLDVAKRLYKVGWC